MNIREDAHRLLDELDKDQVATAAEPLRDLEPNLAKCSAEIPQRELKAPGRHPLVRALFPPTLSS